MATIRIVGTGRAAQSLQRALEPTAFEVTDLVRRGEDLRDVAVGVDAVVLATADDALEAVAAAIEPRPEVAVLHLSGSRGLDVLAPHVRRGSLHPLVPLPNGEIGAARLRSGCTFCVSGDPMAAAIACELGGRVVEVADEHRTRYHAAACVAANHVVGLLGQVERLATSIGLDLDCFLDLTRAALDDVAELGTQRALTGPAVRGDWSTLTAHLAALDPTERPGYEAGVTLALQLATGWSELGISIDEAELAQATPLGPVPA